MFGAYVCILNSFVSVRCIFNIKIINIDFFFLRKKMTHIFAMEKKTYSK